MTLVGSESNKPGAPVAEGKENLEVKKEAEDKSASVKKAEERPKASKKNSASGDAIKSGRTLSKALLLCLACENSVILTSLSHVYPSHHRIQTTKTDIFGSTRVFKHDSDLHTIHDP